MALKYYNVLNQIKETPEEYWKNLMQASVNETWEDTATIQNVNGQLSVGSKDYGIENLQVNSVIDPKTNKDFGDNYKKIIYKIFENNRLPPDVVPASQFLVSSAGGVNLYRYMTINNEYFLVRSSDRYVGKYYRFDGYTWLTINTNTIVGALATAILQKCNQKLKWYDKSGNYHEWDCVFARTLSEKNFNYGKKSVIEVGADAIIQVQQNDETKTINYNQRFIINGKAFQVKQINDYVSTTYMELYVFEVQVQVNDDIVNNISNSKGDIEDTSNGTILLPEINEILLNQTIYFSVYNYTNGEKNQDTYSIEIIGGIENINYKLLVINGNNFSIKNTLSLNEPIEIKCVNTSNSTDVVTKKIILGGSW